MYTVLNVCNVCLKSAVNVAEQMFSHVFPEVSNLRECFCSSVGTLRGK